MADNPDGAHLRGLNANMIQAVDTSGKEDVATLNHDNRHESRKVEKQNEDSEGNVRLVCFIAEFPMS